jgi:DNA transposition AAA+ family ATPase
MPETRSSEEKMMGTDQFQAWKWMKFALQTRRDAGEGTIGLVCGPPGCGKTTALEAWMERVAQAGIHAVSIEALEKSSLRDLLDAILDSLHTHSSNRAYTDVIEDVVQAMRYHRLDLLLIDQAELLPLNCYDTMPYLFQETQCILLLVGNLSLEKKLQRDSYLWSRIAGRLSFKPPAIEEVLAEILPSFDMANFQFDATRESDQELGRAIWKLVGPSLRDLSQTLERASEIAEMAEKEVITLAMVHRAYPQAVHDAPPHTWGLAQWVVATLFLQQEYKDAYYLIERGGVKLNDEVLRDWQWIIQPGDTLSSPYSESRKQSLVVEEKHIRQANALARRIARIKPGGRPPFL